MEGGSVGAGGGAHGRSAEARAHRSELEPEPGNGRDSPTSFPATATAATDTPAPSDADGGVGDAGHTAEPLLGPPPSTQPPPPPNHPKALDPTTHDLATDSATTTNQAAHTHAEEAHVVDMMAPAGGTLRSDMERLLAAGLASSDSEEEEEGEEGETADYLQVVSTGPAALPAAAALPQDCGQGVMALPDEQADGSAAAVPPPEPAASKRVSFAPGEQAEAAQPAPAPDTAEADAAREASTARLEAWGTFVETGDLLLEVLDAVLGNLAALEAPHPDQAVETDSRFYDAFQNICGALHVLQIEALGVARVAPLFDLDGSTPGNGYRSLLVVVHKALEKLKTPVEYFSRSHKSKLFRADACFQDLSDYGLEIITTLTRILRLAGQLVDAKSEFLFVGDALSDAVIKEVDSMARECFYGQALAFYYPAEVQSVLKMVGLCMAGYSVAHEEKSGGAFTRLRSAVFSSSKFYFRHREKAKQLVETVQSGNIDFTKAFWNLLDTTPAKHLGKILAPNVAVNVLLEIPVSEDQLVPRTSRTLALDQDDDTQAWTLINDAGNDVGQLVLSNQADSEAGSEAPDHEAELLAAAAAGADSGGGAHHPAAEEEQSPPSASRRQGSSRRRRHRPVTVIYPEETLGGAESPEAEDPAPSDDTAPSFYHSRQRLTAQALRRAQAHPVPSTSDAWVMDNMEEFATVQVRLICSTKRYGQILNSKMNKHCTKGAPPSPYLLVHFHGGGFVAQSSMSHEIYLRRWAKDLDVPILSVDYKLAPEAPYPTPLEECFYAYRWALNNADLLGSTAERVIVTGDSAGGNLAAAVILRCIKERIPVPHAAVLTYPALNLQFEASPARLLSIFDPLLPQGILKTCLGAYTTIPAHEFATEDPLLSPLSASDELLAEFPPCTILAAALDPLLDDSVQFARELRRLGRDVHLKVFEDLPHGFLNLVRAGPDVQAANRYCVGQLKRHFGIGADGGEDGADSKSAVNEAGDAKAGVEVKEEAEKGEPAPAMADAVDQVLAQEEAAKELEPEATAESEGVEAEEHANATEDAAALKSKGRPGLFRFRKAKPPPPPPSARLLLQTTQAKELDLENGYC